MKKELYLCDKCGKEGAQQLLVHIDWQPDVAGGPSQEMYEPVDLCPGCLTTELKKLLNSNKYSDEERQDWLRPLWERRVREERRLAQPG